MGAPPAYDDGSRRHHEANRLENAPEPPLALDMVLTPMVSVPYLGRVATVVRGDFEWDAAKAAANVVKHGVSFEEAITAF